MSANERDKSCAKTNDEIREAFAQIMRNTNVKIALTRLITNNFVEVGKYSASNIADDILDEIYRSIST